MAWLNGVAIDERDMNPFALLRLLRRERGIMGSLMSLGLSSEQAVELLTHMSIAKAQSESGALDGLFDASDRAEGGGVERPGARGERGESTGDVRLLSRSCSGRGPVVGEAGVAGATVDMARDSSNDRERLV